MSSIEKNKLLDELSNIAITGLRQSIVDGQMPTRESLRSFLEKMPQVHDFIDYLLPGDKDETAVDDSERLIAQREKLVRQLSGLEEQLEQNDRISKRIMIFLSEWLRTETEGSLSDALSQFKDVLKGRTDPQLYEQAFNDLKTQAMREDKSQKTKKENSKKSLISRLVAKETPKELEKRYVEQFRLAYREIVNELGLDLGTGFLSRLEQLGKQINNSQTFDDFTALRKDILDLLHVYIETVALDREKTAEFIQDIGRKLSEVEMDLIRTLGLTDGIFNENSLFNDNLIEEISALEDSMGYSSRIEELKSVVDSKLRDIRSAVMKKKETDNRMKSDLDEDVNNFKAEFEGLKKEAMAAKAQAEQLEREIFMDPMTGAMNRRAYEKRLKEEFERYIRYKRVFSLLMFDVDHFKRINDTYGHATGDIVLKEIIKRVNPLIRECDMLARYGGEEFIVILPETGKSGAVEVGEKLRKLVEHIEFLHRDEQLKITISVGVTECRPEDKTPMDLFNRMDTAMYDAKRGGRNRVACR